MKNFLKTTGLFALFCAISSCSLTDASFKTESDFNINLSEIFRSVESQTSADEYFIVLEVSGGFKKKQTRIVKKSELDDSKTVFLTVNEIPVKSNIQIEIKIYEGSKETDSPSYTGKSGFFTVKRGTNSVRIKVSKNDGTESGGDTGDGGETGDGGDTGDGGETQTEYIKTQDAADGRGLEITVT